MKKIFFISLTLALTMFLSGCSKKTSNQIMGTEGVNAPAEENEQETEISDEEAQKNKDEFLSWIGKKEGIKCTITTSEATIDFNLKNEKTKIEEKDKDNNVLATTLNDGEWIYLWSEEDGVKFKAESEKKSEDSWNSQDDIDYLAEEASVNKFECNQIDIQDSVFTPPTNVQFTEESETEAEL